MPVKSHKTRTRIITASAVVVIFVAVIFSTFRIAVPYVPSFVNTIEQQLSQHLGVTVQIEKVDAGIQWLTPRLTLIDVDVIDPQSQQAIFHFDQVSLSLAWIQSLKNLRPELGFISLAGVDMKIYRHLDGSISVQGFKLDADDNASKKMPEEIVGLLENTSIYVFDSTVRWTDEVHNTQTIDFSQVNLALLNDAGRHQFSINMELPDNYGDHMEMVFHIDGPINEPLNWKGSMYVGVDDFQLSTWLDDYWDVFNFAGNGSLDTRIWISWDKQVINQVSISVDADDVSLLYLDEDIRSWNLQHVMGHARWLNTDSGWQADIRSLEIVRNNIAWPKPAAISLQSNQSENKLISRADFLRVEDLAYLAGLAANFIPDKKYNWNELYDAYSPRGDLHDLYVELPLGQWQAAIVTTQFNNLGYTTTLPIPAATGLDGRLTYDGVATVLNLNSKNVDLDFNNLFRNHLLLESLSGEVSFTRKNDSWHLHTHRIDANTPHLSTSSRMHLIVPDNGDPQIDLVTRYRGGDGSYKSLYFPTAVMGEDTVNWLDRAIVKADVPEGGFLLHGGLYDYPYANGEGVFQVLFDIENATLQYLPEWPALENLSAQIQFHNRSMSIENGRGNIRGAKFFNTTATIENLAHSHLSIVGDVSSSLGELLRFSENSPLKDTFGDYVLGLETKGQTELNINIEIPLEDDASTSVSGVLGFKDNEIYLPEEGYRFHHINGELRFTESLIQASAIDVSLDSHPLQLDITTFEGNKNYIRLAVAGDASIGSVLTPFPEVAGYLDGNAYWDINIDIPKDNVKTLLDIGVRSNLRGVTSRLPGSMAKVANDEGQFEVLVTLFEQGLDLDVEYENAYKLDAHLDQQKWLIDYKSKELTGLISFMHDFRHDIPIELNIDNIDVGALLGDDASTSDIEISAKDIPPMNMQIARLIWNDYVLSDINAQTSRNDKGMVIEHFEAHSSSVNLMGKGSWLSSWRFDDRTSLQFTMDTNDLGRTLSEFKLTDSLIKTQGQASFNWTWPGMPHEFSWDNLSGNAQLNLSDGQFKNIDVGAGRLIGIFNFSTLLSLDFGRQGAGGFAFDKLRGDINFSSGNAYTSNLEIDSKVAEITLDGRIGLTAEDYDQTITVIPGVGSTLTVIGAVTGGPVTAVAVHLFQKLFGINKIAQYKYSVTGSWENPEVKLIAAPESSSGEANEN